MTAHQQSPRYALIITGPVGSGKTSVMTALTELLEKHNKPAAGIDMDHLRWFFPRPAGDPFGSAVGRQHLAFMAANYRSLGIPVLAIADVIENETGRQKMAETLPDYEVQVIRLRVPMELIEQRLRLRESPETLEWYLHRAPELERILDTNQVGDYIVDVGERPVQEVAAEIARRYGLIRMI